MVASGMPVRVTRHDVETIAALAQLALTDAEIDQFAAELTAILDFAAQVNEVDTSGVEATAHVVAAAPRLRPDEPQRSLARADALANAPDADPEAGWFRVPRVLGA
jgi:aspartyl-tRNA(Asn)/glutamyl-tRNA(Gln) amidotransferase subunit C